MTEKPGSGGKDNTPPLNTWGLIILQQMQKAQAEGNGCLRKYIVAIQEATATSHQDCSLWDEDFPLVRTIKEKLKKGVAPTESESKAFARKAGKILEKAARVA